MSEFTFHFPTPSTPDPTNPQSNGGKLQQPCTGNRGSLQGFLLSWQPSYRGSGSSRVLLPGHRCAHQQNPTTAVGRGTTPPVSPSPLNPQSSHARTAQPWCGVGCSTWRKSLPVSEISAMLERRDWLAHGLRNCDRASTASCHVCPQI